jgi:hypothetical protein
MVSEWQSQHICVFICIISGQHTWDPEEDHDESYNVETGVHAKGAEWSRLRKQKGEGNAKDGGPAQACRDGKGHAHLTVRQRIDLGRVGEGHRTFTWRVEGAEQVNEQANQRRPDSAILGCIGDES